MYKTLSNGLEKKVMKFNPDLMKIYSLLLERHGFLHWWPARTEFEVMLGAILTQNTSWTNVSKALENLRKTGSLSFAAIKRLPVKRLSSLIRPSGYYNQKADRIKNYVLFLEKSFKGSIKAMKRVRLHDIRNMLLSLKGIGFETADSIILYALGKRIFVVDAYTKRVFSRLGLIPQEYGYEQIQEFFMRNISPSVNLYKDYHAQIVMLGKNCCRKKPRCYECPVVSVCRFARSRLVTD